MAKWLGAPLGGVTTSRAKDTDRQDTCMVFADAPADGELSAEEHQKGSVRPPTSSATSSTDGPVPVDLSKFDVTKTVDLVRGGPETLHTKPSDLETTYLIIEPATTPTTRGALALSLYVSSDYGGGHISFSGDGTVKQTSLPT
ncbi:MAG: hypothetical protein WA768_06820 [Mycobacterium sp.]